MAELILLAFLAILPLSLAQGQGTPLLFLGPAYDKNFISSGKSEVFSLSAPGGNLTTASCTVPDYPVTDILGYVAFVKDGYLQLCGGADDAFNTSPRSLSSCYVLMDSAWVATTPLMSPRYVAAATTLHNGSVLVTGGLATNKTPLSSSEMLTGTTWSPALRTPRYGHCMLTLSSGDIFLHGGVYRSGASGGLSDTYISTDLTSWENKTSSEITRLSHGCTEVTLGIEQEVWVGGKGTTEIYSVSNDAWRTGPALPSNNSYPEFVSLNGQLYLADGDTRNIYRLKAGWTQEDDGWEKIGEMTSGRVYFKAMIISQDTCEGCGRTNKQTFLKNLRVVTKVKTSSDCQALCAEYSGCTHFEWKKVANRSCKLQAVGYKTKKNFVSGSVGNGMKTNMSLSCGRANKRTFLRSLNIVSRVKTCSECKTLCTEYSVCTHFEWKYSKKVAKRTCTLQKVGYKNKKNFVSGPVGC